MLDIVRRKISELNSDSRNARIHTERNISAIMDSLKEFEQYKPIVVQKNTNRVLAGNGTLQAARMLGWDEIDTVEADVDNFRAIRLALADNRTAELGDWDFQLLSELMDSYGSDEMIPGFTDEEMDVILDTNVIDERYDTRTESRTDYKSRKKDVPSIRFSFGEISIKLSFDCYNDFLEHLPDVGIARFVTKLITF